MACFNLLSVLSSLSNFMAVQECVFFLVLREIARNLGKTILP